MIRKLLVLVIVTAASLAQAAEPSQRSIEKLLVLTQADKMIDAIKPQVATNLKLAMDQGLKGRTVGPAEQKVLEDFVAKSTRIVAEDLTLERMKPLYFKLYAQYFTQKDVDGLIAFYQSPAGKTMTTKMPQLMQGMMASMPDFMAPTMEKVHAASMQMRAELEALPKDQN